LKEELGACERDVSKSNETRNPSIEQRGLKLQAKEVRIMRVESRIEVALHRGQIYPVIFSTGVIAHNGKCE